MAERTRLEVDRETQRRLRSLERRLARMASSIPNGGTTALRDATYPPPSSVAEQVFLANRQIQWYNTDRGWMESYYAPSGAAGLTARGLLAGAAANWYPIGTGPEIVMEPNAEIAVATGSPTTYVGGWAGTVRRNGGSSSFTNDSGAIIAQRAGFYDLHAWTVQLAGTGTPNYHLVITNSGNVELTRHDGGVFPLQSSLFTTVEMSMRSKFMNVGDKLVLRLWSGSGMVVHKGSGTDTRGQLSAYYVRPPLVSD